MILISENRKSLYNYFLINSIEAGIVLTGTEVKSLRKNKVTLNEAYVDYNNDEMWVHNLHIAEYNHGNRFNHDPKRLKKLLLHRKEIKKFIGSIKRENTTIIPLSIYFNDRGKVKLKIGLAKGKKKYDKRETIKQRDWDRAKSRLIKQT